MKFKPYLLQVGWFVDNEMPHGGLSAYIDPTLVFFPIHDFDALSKLITENLLPRRVNL